MILNIDTPVLNENTTVNKIRYIPEAKQVLLDIIRSLRHVLKLKMRKFKICI